MSKPTVCVLFGGKSSEYSVSLRSAYAVLSAIDQSKYRVIKIGISKSGEWLLFTGKNEDILGDKWQLSNGCVPIAVDPSKKSLLKWGKKGFMPILPKIDIIFPVMHGEYVEDGRLQGLFDIAGIKYLGCDAFASHICMDKHLTKKEAMECGIKVAKWVRVCKNTPICVDNLQLPLFVKPAMSGSSVGVHRVEDKADLAGAVQDSLKYCGSVLIEEAIEGDEVEVAVMESKGQILVSSVGMLKYKGSFYDYEEKYINDSCEYIIPAPLNIETEEHIRKAAKELFAFFGCKGLSRFDFFVKKSGEVVFNEVNTMPGFTEISMFPKLFAHCGFTYSQIIDCLIEEGLKKDR